MITLQTTSAGRAQINAALSGDGPAPVLARMALGSGTPPDPASATAGSIAGQFLQPAVQLAITRHDADIISGTAGFAAPAAADVVTWVALLYRDGTPAAVGVIEAGMPRIPGMHVELPWAWASADISTLTLDISIIDVNQLRDDIYHAVTDRLDRNNLGIAETRINPIARAMHHVLRDGNPLMHIELFADPYSLRGGDALAISGVIAGDDSIDLAEHTDTLLDGDYLIFGGGHTETVRLLTNLELGRRRLEADIQHTYPTAILGRTNWTITPGEAIAAPGQVYYSKPLPLADNARTHRVIVRAQTAAGAPEVAMRANSDGSYVAGTLIKARPAADGSAGYSDYLFDVRCADNIGHLRITTPVATRVRSVVVASAEQMTRVVGAPIVLQDGLTAPDVMIVAGNSASITLRSTSHLVNGRISEFVVEHDGMNHLLTATDNSWSGELKFVGTAGDKKMLHAVAVDMLGNYSAASQRVIAIVEPITHQQHNLIGSGSLVVPAGAQITATGRGAPGTGGTTSVSYTPSVTGNEYSGNVSVPGQYGSVLMRGGNAVSWEPAVEVSGSGLGPWSVRNDRCSLAIVVMYSQNVTSNNDGRPGASTTLTIPGNPPMIFSGGNPAASESTLQYKNGAEAIVVNYDVPPGGSLTIRW